jgi:DNA-directed RNA polymerase specialized sigma24 family protein
VNREAAGQVWEDNIAMVYSIVRAFMKKYGGTEDEFLSECGLGFAKAIESFAEDKETQFLSWAHTKMFRQCQEYVRVRAKRKTKAADLLDSTTLDASAGSEMVPLLDIMDSIAGAGEDAIIMARLIIEAPAALRAEVAASAKHVRSSIGRFMSENYDWSPTRAKVTLRELEEALAQ